MTHLFLLIINSFLSNSLTPSWYSPNHRHVGCCSHSWQSAAHRQCISPHVLTRYKFISLFALHRSSLFKQFRLNFSLKKILSNLFNIFQLPFLNFLGDQLLPFHLHLNLTFPDLFLLLSWNNDGLFPFLHLFNLFLTLSLHFALEFVLFNLLTFLFSFLLCFYLSFLFF